MILDTSNKYMYFVTTDNKSDNFVSIFDSVKNKLISNLSLPFAYDYSSLLYVPNSNEVWIPSVDSNSKGYFEIVKGTKLKSIIPTNSTESIYNPSNGYVYTLSGDIYDGKTNNLLETLDYSLKCGGNSVTYPTSLIYVPYNKMVYVSNSAYQNSCKIHDYIAVISGKSLSTRINLPTIGDSNDVLAYDPADNGLFVGGTTSYGYTHLRLINIKTVKLVATLAFRCVYSGYGCAVTPYIYSPYNHNLYVLVDSPIDHGTESKLYMINSFNHKISSLGFLDTSFGYLLTYDFANNNIYILSSDYFNGVYLDTFSTVSNHWGSYFELDDGYGGIWGGIVFDSLNMHVYVTAQSFDLNNATMFIVSSY